MLAAATRGESALLVAATGAGKTLSGFLPTLVDLAQHRKAVQAREAAAKAAREMAARQAKSGGSMLGGRRHAGLILIVVIVALLAIFVLPRLL